MKRLPSAKSLATDLLAQKRGRKTLAHSAAYLVQHRSVLAKYGSVEAFVTSQNTSDQAVRQGAEYHLRQLRAALARELWSRQLFIGVTVLDDLLFHAFGHHGGSAPLQRVLELIRDHEVHHPGLVVFPVHSFGVRGAGFLHWYTDSRIEYMVPEFDIALAPQSNSLDGTLRFLERSRETLGVRRRVPRELIEHWFLSRNAQWLVRNPLLVIKVQSFPGDYYENQFLLLSKLRAATAVLSMMAALQGVKGRGIGPTA